MIAVAGVFNNGIISLFKRVTTKKPVNVVVTFLEENAEICEIKEKKGINDFSFLNVIEATKDVNISISDALIEEKRKELLL